MATRSKKMRTMGVVTVVGGVLAFSQALTGCGDSTPTRISKMLDSGDAIDIDLSISDGSSMLAGVASGWMPLSYLTGKASLRDALDDAWGVLSHDDLKNGTMYVNPSDETYEPNNTLENAFKNKAFVELLDDSDTIDQLRDAVSESYDDIDSDTDDDVIKLAAIDAYFDLFTDDDESDFNGGSYLARKDWEAGLAKAHFQAEDGVEANEDAIDSLGMRTTPYSHSC